MYYIYVLKSLKSNKRYIGSTSKNPPVRLKEHNQGSNTWSKHNRPFRLLHVEIFVTKTEALRRERFLKSGQGRKYLDQNLGV